MSDNELILRIQKGLEDMQKLVKRLVKEEAPSKPQDKEYSCCCHLGEHGHISSSCTTCKHCKKWKDEWYKKEGLENLQPVIACQPSNISKERCTEKDCPIPVLDHDHPSKPEPKECHCSCHPNHLNVQSCCPCPTDKPSAPSSEPDYIRTRVEEVWRDGRGLEEPTCDVESTIVLLKDSIAHSLAEQRKELEANYEAQLEVKKLRIKKQVRKEIVERFKTSMPKSKDDTRIYSRELLEELEKE